MFVFSPVPKRIFGTNSSVLQNPRRKVMQNQAATTLSVSGRTPWNKGRLIGAKPPLRPKHVWTIRTKLQVEHRTRDLAMFNLAIDSKLRGCDVVALRVEDVAPYGVALDRATVRQRKTGLAVRFELTEPTRDAVDDYIKATGKKPGDFLSLVVTVSYRYRRGNMRDLCRRGLPKSDWIRSFSEPIHSAEPRRL